VAGERRRATCPALSLLPRQSGHDKRLRAAISLLRHVIQTLALDTVLWIDATRSAAAASRYRTPHLLEPGRQLTESVNDALKGQLDRSLIAHDR
jgi:hypothetical protein